jgi:uncharacterized protein YndB with AHSA1/START domain
MKRSITHATFSLERVYSASPAKVFAAFAKPEQKTKWFGGPPEWEGKHSMDFRVGGRESSVGGPKGGQVHRFDALYEDIVPDERICYTYDLYLDDTRISVSLATIELRPEGKGTRLVLTEMGAFFDGWEDPKLREGGTVWLLDKLAKLLEG